MQSTNHIPSIIIANATKDAEELILETIINPLLKDLKDLSDNEDHYTVLFGDLDSKLTSLQYLCDDNLITIILTFSYGQGTYKSYLQAAHDFAPNEDYNASAHESLQNAATQAQSELNPILDDILGNTYLSKDIIATDNTLTYIASYSF